MILWARAWISLFLFLYLLFYLFVFSLDIPPFLLYTFFIFILLLCVFACTYRHKRFIS
ncbi:hypothetical protein B0H66DRAFT_563431 [Apodospora peruviana]|uniref:Uncharacterized protein n=1 Tax=Apodospora peruviana TaxID=516989 RepID=A0AAE0M0R7_9PEZI|nr:hypothetical protein B0H66DRAFT_563431 [Apodospora peruviana]